MKTLLTFAALVFLSVSSLAQQTKSAKSISEQTATGTVSPPQHPITAEQTRELFELGGVKSMMEQFISRALLAQRSSAPYIPAAVWADLTQSLLQVDFAKLLTPTYQKYLSQEDAEQIAAFYRTPAGKHLLEVMPQVMTDAAEVGSQEGQRIAMEVLQRHQQEILDAKRKYDEQQNKPGADLPKAPSSESKPDGAK